MLPIQQQIQDLATRFCIGAYFDNRAKRDNKPWITFKHNGLVLADFFNEETALNWFPKDSRKGRL